MLYGKHLILYQDKNSNSNYNPISLLPIFGKIFEKIIFDKICNFLLYY